MSDLTQESRALRDLAPDALRGFALLGILLVNIPFLAVSSDEGARGQWVSGSANNIATFIMVALFQGKFYLLFSFLYGYSSHYIVKGERANRKRWVKRCFLLILLGALHFTFLWHGDILFAYGLFGLLFIPFLFRKDRTLKIWAILLYLFFAVMLTAIAALTYFAEQVDPESFIVNTPDLDKVMLSGNYLESLAPRAELWALGFFGSGILVQGGFAFIAFLVGLRAARASALNLDSGIWSREQSTSKMMKIGYLIGLPIQLACAAVFLWNEHQTKVSEGLFILTIIISFTAAPLLSMAYVGSILRLLKQRPGWFEGMRNAGQMSLTTYLMQSLILTLIFGNWGLGLFQSIDIWLVFLMGIAIWLLQLRFASFWIAKYRQGPFENLVSRFTKGSRLAN